MMGNWLLSYSVGKQITLNFPIKVLNYYYLGIYWTLTGGMNNLKISLFLEKPPRISVNYYEETKSETGNNSCPYTYKQSGNPWQTSTTIKSGSWNQINTIIFSSIVDGRFLFQQENHWTTTTPLKASESDSFLPLSFAPHFAKLTLKELKVKRYFYLVVKTFGLLFTLLFVC